LGALVLGQVAYPVTSGDVRTLLIGLIVVLGFTASVGHAFATRGRRAGIALIAITTGGGLAVEAIGVATGFPFGDYEYGALRGPTLLGVPFIIPLAWTWMAWPAWIAAGHIVRVTSARIALAGVGLAAWDLFLDPQMVAESHWRWSPPLVTLPGVDTVPVGNYAGWLGVALLMMSALTAAAGPRAQEVDRRTDAPMLALYLWTYVSSVLAHAVFLGLPGSALWGGLGMGLVAGPLAVTLVRR
jgi:putative membrane protein